MAVSRLFLGRICLKSAGSPEATEAAMIGIALPCGLPPASPCCLMRTPDPSSGFTTAWTENI